MMQSKEFSATGEEQAMKAFAVIAISLSFAGAAWGQQSVAPDRLGSWVAPDADACSTLYGNGRDMCLASHYQMQQDKALRDQQLALQRAQEENQRLHNDLLKRELTRPVAAPSPADLAAIPGFADWHADNGWFGPDRARTEYALLYARDLRRDQPELSGRALLNALSVRVKEVFSTAKR